MELKGIKKMKTEFLNFVDELIKHDENFSKSIMTDDIKDYLEILRKEKPDHIEITDNGKVILKYMQDNDVRMSKAKDIAEGLGISSRTVSGSLRKLVTDGFVDKVSTNPTIYAISEKGKNYKID